MRQLIIGVLVTVASASGQNPSFEVASIKLAAPAPPIKGEPEGGVSLAGGTVRMQNVTLRDMILAAYGIRDHQLFGAASLKADRYDVAAKASGPANDEQVRLMLQGMLAERFRLVVHHDTKEIAVSELVVAKGGPKLGKPKPEGPSSIGIAQSSLTFQNYSLSKLADFLSQRSGGRPIVDATKVDGYYDFSVALLDAAPDDPISAKRAVGTAMRDGSLPGTVAAALGLRLENRNGPVDIIVVDSASRLAEN